jgi:predicted DNA-binding transcriptional regulator YafY
LAEEQLLPARWGQERRLEFIEFRLQWEGRVNRSDLVNYFSISVPQASLDFARYRELAPKNTVYDVVQKAYLPSPNFTPTLIRESADDYLIRLWGATAGTMNSNSSFLGWTPSVGIVRDPARLVDAAILRVFLLALREKLVVRIDYQSMSTTVPSSRTISPHAVGFDGFRWHVRAFCHVHNDYRDFVLGRVRSAVSEGPTEIDPKDDADWHNFIQAIIVPHPRLSKAQKQAVESDYNMEHGRLVLRVREALLFYHLDHLGLLEPAENSKKYIALENRAGLRSFFEKHHIESA